MEIIGFVIFIIIAGLTYCICNAVNDEIEKGKILKDVEEVKAENHIHYIEKCMKVYQDAITSRSSLIDDLEDSIQRMKRELEGIESGELKFVEDDDVTPMNQESVDNIITELKESIDASENLMKENERELSIENEMLIGLQAEYEQLKPKKDEDNSGE